MLKQLHEFFVNKKVLLLGFGLEGQSTLRMLKKLNCCKSITVWEKYQHTDDLPPSNECDIIVKSPGIPLFKSYNDVDLRITGQADLFLRFCENTPVVGITGTKGKSTTASLLHHILTECNIPSKLIGNIGVPPLDVAHELTGEESDDVIVMELSCHQLEYVKASPKIAILLNIYEEHLDHYIDFAHYRAAKENIYRFQQDGDILIRGEDVDCSEIDFSQAKLRGKHNLHNIAVAIKAAELFGAKKNEAIKAGCGFGGLEHRLELFCEIDGVLWVNDSISTVPEAAIAAAEAFPEMDTLIIGGMDRGVDYSSLTAFLQTSQNAHINVIALPDSGHKLVQNLPRAYKAKDLNDGVNYAKRITRRCCVLSPAAASYGFYKNFEERGKHFKELVVGSV